MLFLKTSTGTDGRTDVYERDRAIFDVIVSELDKNQSLKPRRLNETERSRKDDTLILYISLNKSII